MNARRPVFRWARWISAVAILAPSLFAADQPFLIKDGRSQAEIVVAPQPSRMARLAAGELQTYLHKISGARLPITAEPGENAPFKIYVGRSAHTEARHLSVAGLAHGAFRMASGADWLALLGPDRDFTPREPWARAKSTGETARVLKEWDAITGETFGNPYLQLFARQSRSLDFWDYDDRGTLNAVHEFLRSLGVRWFAPGELGEVVPPARDIPLPKVDRTVQPDFAVRSLRFFSDHVSMSEDELMWQLRLGLNLGHELLGTALPGHGSKFVYTRAEVKQAHPEFYAIWNGRRATEHKGSGAPCLSAPGLFTQHVKYTRAVLDHYQEPMLSLDVCDGYGFGLCECGLCKGKGTPERGFSGNMSDYVHGYINRVAAEIYKTHPDRKVSALAYSAYREPPEKMAQLAPNLAVTICQMRSSFHDRATRESFVKLRQRWLEKLPTKELYTWEYYLENRPDKSLAGIPVVYPQLIAEDLRALKGISKGDMIEVYRHRDPKDYPWDAMAVMHLNLYVTSRFWWDAGQSLEAVLADYYAAYYGPAREEMRAFIEFAEGNWMKMTKSVDLIDRAFALLERARQTAGDTAYGKRIDLIMAYTQPMKLLRARLALGRQGAPEARAQTRDERKLKLDGRLDDEFWAGLHPYRLTQLQTGGKTTHETTFKVAQTGTSICFGIQCFDSDMGHLNYTATKNEDPSVWNGDNVELLIETPSHSYYQFNICPSGAFTDADRKTGLNTEWSSGAEVVAHRAADHWSVEVRIPHTDEMQGVVETLKGVVGRVPTQTYPWFFNLGRQRVRGEDRERSAFSPTGVKTLHEPMKFGQLIGR
jgi:hypothetical protein